MHSLAQSQVQMRQRQSACSEYLTPAEVAARLKLSVKTVIRRFENRSGVLNLGSERKLTKKSKREKYAILRIPETALSAFIAEHMVP